MIEYDALKNSILQNICVPVVEGPWFELSGYVTGEIIQNALDTYNNVSIPDLGYPIILEKSILLSSNQHLQVASHQIIMQGRNMETCLLRNKNIQNGAYGPTNPKKRDRNISVEGGIWNIRKKQRCYADEEKTMKGAIGAIIFSGIEQFSLKNMRIFDSYICGPAGTTSPSYGLQLSDCKSFTVENIDFYSNSRDGCHINGPAQYGSVRHIRGEKMGDDMIAVNAWEWDSSGITFGNIHHIFVEDVVGTVNEMRLHPGEKIYEDGTRNSCDITDCIFQDIRGIYTCKIYAQPNIYNVIIPGTYDVPGSVGKVERIIFKDIVFRGVRNTGFAGVPVRGLFEICSDCKELSMENISVEQSKEYCDALGVKLVNVGPLSFTWKNGSEDPSRWGEIFDPNAICSADDLFFKNIQFAGDGATEATELIRSIRMHINEDYPRTTPLGGTGYGTIGNVVLENSSSTKEDTQRKNNGFHTNG